MGRTTGTADLPLHGGRVPAWLHQRMARLGRVITEAIVFHYGRDEFLRRMAHPFWFQSFGAVMGMDWHSSGITTSVVGALKRSLSPVADELGIYVCGGRGKNSRLTPDELVSVGERTGLDGGKLANTSKLVAKVDSAAVQDGFELYLHAFLVTADGKWTVVQQGMNPDVKTARRYHWLSETIRRFDEEPHSAIEGKTVGNIMNLVDKRAEASRHAQVMLANEGPDAVVQAIRSAVPHMQLPEHHDVLESDVFLRRVHGAMRAAQENGPKDFSELLMTPGVGRRTVFALAQVAEVVHGAPSRFADPARFSLAHGGKDGHPYPVPLKVFDRTIGVLKDAVRKAKLGNDEKLEALKRLDEQARALEANATGPTFHGFLDEERRNSHVYGGMTVNGPAQPVKERKPRQMELWGMK